jgi:asparagine synthase (glutamine-hydrolysing)
LFDEPFADASQIPTLILSELTRKHVTVAVSGDGGDELFAGYAHYRLLEQVWKHARRVPLPVQSAAASALRSLPWHRLNTGQLGRAATPGHIPFAHRMMRLAEVLPVTHPDELYRRRYSHWPRPDEIVLHAAEPRGTFWRDFSRDIPGFVDRMQLLDQLTYMTDDVLSKVDRTSMAVSLEVRVPLLDHRVVDAAWALSPEVKIKRGRGKWPLREILARYVPRTLTERPKQGFNPPLASWLRGALREWAASLIAPERLRAEGLLQPEAINALWRSFLNGSDQPWDDRRLWDVVLFQAWYEARQSPPRDMVSGVSDCRTELAALS